MANETKEKILNTRIINKHALLSEWDSSELILKDGEIALAKVTVAEQHADGKISEVPAYLVKVGTGDKTFKETAWAYAKAADVHAWAKKSEIEFKEWAGTNIDTDTDTRYTFALDNGKLVVKSKLYSKGVAGTTETNVAEIDFLTQDEFDTRIAPILEGYVKSVNKKDGTAIEVDNADKQNPKVGLKIDATSSNATGGTAVKLSQSNNGLKAEVDLSNFATKAEIPTDFGVLSVTGDTVVVADPKTGHVVLDTKLDNSGNVKFEKTNAGLKGNVDLTHDHDGVYKPIQEVVNETGSVSKTVTSVKQNENGEITEVKFEDIAITESQITDLHKVEVAEGAYINVTTSTNTAPTGSVTTTYTVAVDEAVLSSKIAAVTTAAMEFKGATSVLPTSSNNAGDMYKISGSFDVPAANDAQGTGFTTKIGDSIVYDGSKWYLIPSGDDIEDTWRMLQVNDTELPSSNTVNFVDGDAIEVQSSSADALTTITVNHAYVTCSSQINGSPVDLAHGGTISVISDIAVNRHGHVEGYTQDYYNLPEQYVHPEADVTSTSTNVALSHGDTFVVKNETFDETGHVKTETTTTYTLPEATDISGKMDKVPGASANHYAIFDENGQVVDGGYITAFTQADAQNFELTYRETLWSDTYTKVDGVRFELSEKLDSASDSDGEAILDMTLRPIIDEIEIYDQYGYPNDNWDKEDGVLSGKRILIGLSEKARTSLAKADSAVQTITSNCTAGQETSGLKVTPNKNDKNEVIPGSVNIEIDDAVTFIFDCGGAE